MNRKFILGSGVVGLMARSILGPSWSLIPFGRSRFYSYKPALASDHLVHHNDLDEIMLPMILNVKPVFLQRAYSFGGELIFSDESFAKLGYIDKVFGADQHPAVKQLIRSSSIVYQTSVTSIYESLLTQYRTEISKAIDEWGVLNSIADHTLKMENGTFEYDQIISTIPLDALCGYIGTQKTLPARDVWFYNIETSSLNFEGAAEVMVCDGPFDFFKVDRINRVSYVFHCLKDLGNPLAYLGAFTNNNLRIVNETSMPRAIPVGAPPHEAEFKAKGISLVGAHAQWDTFMDVSSSIRRILKLRGL